MMKRFFCMLLAVALIMGLSVQSFAYDEFLPFDINEYSSVALCDDDSENTVFGILQTSALSDEAREYMTEFFSVLTGQSTSEHYHYVLYYHTLSTDTVKLHFIRGNTCTRYDGVMVEPRLNFCYNYESPSAASMISVYGFTYPRDNSSSVVNATCHYEEFRLTSDSDGFFVPYSFQDDKNMGTSSIAVLSSQTASSATLKAVGGILWTNDPNINESAYTTSAKYLVDADDLFPTYSGYLAFRDDDGLIESVTPDPEPDENENEGGTTGGDSSEDPAESGGSSGGGESEEPPSSGTEDNENIETPKDTTISLPSIDYDSALIPYDLDLWNLAPAAFFPQLKKIVIVGMPIIIACIAIELLIKLIRHFAFSWFNKGGGSGGGGISVD